MYKILLGLLTVLLVVGQSFAAAGAGGVVTNSALRSNESGANAWAVKLGTCNGTKGATTATGNDTLQNAKQNVYGPYNLSRDRDRPNAKAIRLLCPASSIKATDTLAVAYSLMAGNAITDTTTWTALDTIKGTLAKSGTAVDLSGSPAIAIAFKMTAIGSNGALISKPIRIVFIDGRLEQSR